MSRSSVVGRYTPNVSVRSQMILSILFLLIPATGVPQSSWPSPPGVAVPDDATMKRLHTGEVLVTTMKAERTGGAARVQALFHGDVESLWAIIGDCEANFRFVRGLRHCVLEDETRDSAITEMTVKAMWFAPALNYRFETRREPFEWIQIRLLDGDLRSLSGSWRFDLITEDLFLLTHEIDLQPAMPAPSWLVRRTLRKDLSDMIACLRWQAGAWSDPRQRGKDRQKCPA